MAILRRDNPWVVNTPMIHHPPQPLEMTEAQRKEMIEAIERCKADMSVTLPNPARIESMGILHSYKRNFDDVLGELRTLFESQRQERQASEDKARRNQDKLCADIDKLVDERRAAEEARGNISKELEQAKEALNEKVDQVIKLTNELTNANTSKDYWKRRCDEVDRHLTQANLRISDLQEIKRRTDAEVAKYADTVHAKARHIDELHEQMKKQEEKYENSQKNLREISLEHLKLKNDMEMMQKSAERTVAEYNRIKSCNEDLSDALAQARTVHEKTTNAISRTFKGLDWVVVGLTLWSIFNMAMMILSQLGYIK